MTLSSLILSLLPGIRSLMVDMLGDCEIVMLRLQPAHWRLCLFPLSLSLSSVRVRASNSPIGSDDVRRREGQWTRYEIT